MKEYFPASFLPYFEPTAEIYSSDPTGELLTGVVPTPAVQQVQIYNTTDPAYNVTRDVDEYHYYVRPTSDRNLLSVAHADLHAKKGEGGKWTLDISGSGYGGPGTWPKEMKDGNWTIDPDTGVLSIPADTIKPARAYDLVKNNSQDGYRYWNVTAETQGNGDVTVTPATDVPLYNSIGDKEYGVVDGRLLHRAAE